MPLRDSLIPDGFWRLISTAVILAHFRAAKALAGSVKVICVCLCRLFIMDLTFLLSIHKSSPLVKPFYYYYFV